MKRILKCTKDTYITNKIIGGQRQEEGNVGLAGTLDLFKLYDESHLSGTSEPVEVSRALLKFDYSSIETLVSSSRISLSDPSFKCYLKMFNIVGGQPTPRNFNLSVFPLAVNFEEGFGNDIATFQHVNAANWLSSSNGSLWNVSGCFASGAIGQTNVDYFVSGNLSGISESLGLSVYFDRGDENLTLDITKLVSASVCGLIPNHGIRLSFDTIKENDDQSYFVKRFGSRHTTNTSFHPYVEMCYDDSIEDNFLNSYFETSNKIFLYNVVRGEYRNFFDVSGNEITGSNCVNLTLVGSHSYNYMTNSWSITHSASINYLTSSVAYFSSSFSGSLLKTGIYYSTFSMNPQTNPELRQFLSGASSINLLPRWQSANFGETLKVGSSWLNINSSLETEINGEDRNIVTNITNLKQEYTKNEEPRLRVFIQDYNNEMKYSRVPKLLTSEVFSKMFWRLKEAHSKKVVFDFDTINNSTKLSSDGNGMWFDFDMSSLSSEKVYEFEFLVKENGLKDYLILNQGFRFKVLSS
jgi:hypothetical protein